MKFQPPKGTKDLLQRDAEMLNYVVQKVRETFESFGFRQMYTPAFESFDLLSAKGGLGEAVKDEIYYFKDKGDRELGLRFDLTMPLARVVASDSSMPKPFKRFSIGAVWRYDNPQAMRWREFWQADVDTVGSSSMAADAEVVACACACLESLGFKDYYIRVNSRKFLDSKIGRVVPREKIPLVFRALDKLDKIGERGVRAELKKIGCEKDEILQLISDTSSAESEPEVQELLDALKDFGFESRVKVDSSLVRGLDYYTGLVFEVFLGSKVSCGGGGRYDGLIGRVGGQETPAVGISLGIDRVVEAMKEQGLFPEKMGSVRAFVANVDDDSMGDAVKVAQYLRKNGVACQTNVSGRYLSKQLEYANSQGIRYVVVVGKEEVKAKRYKLRDMVEKGQVDLNLDGIVSKLRTV